MAKGWRCKAKYVGSDMSRNSKQMTTSGEGQQCSHLASVRVIFGETLLGSIALRADVAATQLLKRHLVGVDVSAVNADVCGKLLLT